MVIRSSSFLAISALACSSIANAQDVQVDEIQIDQQEALEASVLQELQERILQGPDPLILPGSPDLDGQIPSEIIGYEVDTPEPRIIEGINSRIPIDLEPIVNAPTVPLISNPNRTPLTGVAGAKCGEALGDYFDYQDWSGNLGHYAKQYRDEFVKSCYSAEDRLPDWVKSLKRSVVTIGFRDKGSHCTGILLDNDTVLTAEHCFDGKRRGIQAGANDFCDDYWISTFDGVTKVEISAVLTKGADFDPTNCDTLASSEFGTPEDVVSLRLRAPIEQPAAFDFHPTEDVFPTAGSALLGFGRMPQLDQAEEISATNVVALFSEGCRLMIDTESEGGRILHQCLTVPAMSGGPIFLIQNGVPPRLVGIHQSGLVLGGSSCQSEFDWCSDRHSNLKFLNLGHLIRPARKRELLP